ncbi:MAG: HEAT repeat domain-containing protein [Anaerolineae bacterium]
MFSELLNELKKDEDAPIRSALVYLLSDIEDDDLKTLQAFWPSLPTARRRSLMQRLATLSEEAFELDFRRVARLGLTDPDPGVRKHAIAALWTDDSTECMRLLLERLVEDTDIEVRTAAAQALGAFVLQGEYEEIDPEDARAVEDALLNVIEETDSVDLKRRAIEAIAFSGRREVAPIILEAHISEEQKLRVSAIFAMGRSANPRWHADVLAALDDEDPEIQFAAARAAGELTCREAVPRLIGMLDSGDIEIKHAAIWSLGEIGGDDASEALDALYDEETDPETLEAIEEAMSMAGLMTGNFASMLFDFDSDDPLAGDDE